MALTDEEKQRRRQFAAYLREAMRAAGYARSDEEPDVPRLHRASGVPDNILRRWLQEGGAPSLDNLRQVAPALRVPMRDLVIAAGLMSASEIGLDGEPEPPQMPLTPEDVIRNDDILPQETKEALIQLYASLRGKGQTTEEPGRRKRA